MTAGDEEAARKLFAGPCDFVWGSQSPDNLPPARLPEVAFVGRSNVGKSSLVNALTGRNSLARVSQTPGATRQINFFNLGGRLMLADLPGYGFAKVSKTEQARWQEQIYAYLSGRPTLKRVLLLVDGRHGPKASDIQVMDLLDRAAVSSLVVLTKIDAVPPNDRAAITQIAASEASRHTAALAAIAAASAQSGEGISGLRAHLYALTSSKPLE